MKEILATFAENYDLAARHFCEGDYTYVNARGSTLINKYFNETTLIGIRSYMEYTDINANIQTQLTILENKGWQGLAEDIKCLHSTVISHYFTGGKWNLFPYSEIVASTNHTNDVSIRYCNGVSSIIHSFYIQLKEPNLGDWYGLMNHGYSCFNSRNILINKPCYLIVAMDTRLAVFEYLPDWHRINGFNFKIPTANGLLGLFWNDITHSVEVVPQTNYWYVNTKVYDMRNHNDWESIHNILNHTAHRLYPVPRHANLHTMTLHEATSHYHWSQWYPNNSTPNTRYARIFHANIRTPMQMRHSS